MAPQFGSGKSAAKQSGRLLARAHFAPRTLLAEVRCSSACVLFPKEAKFLLPSKRAVGSKAEGASRASDSTGRHSSHSSSPPDKWKEANWSQLRQQCNLCPECGHKQPQQRAISPLACSQLEPGSPGWLEPLGAAFKSAGCCASDMFAARLEASCCDNESRRDRQPLAGRRRKWLPFPGSRGLNVVLGDLSQIPPTLNMRNSKQWASRRRQQPAACVCVRGAAAHAGRPAMWAGHRRLAPEFEPAQEFNWMELRVPLRLAWFQPKREETKRNETRVALKPAPLKDNKGSWLCRRGAFDGR